MLDFRYHIFYLGLMFLMFGFGIFIGASLTGPGLVRRQTDAIKNLRGEANRVVQERDQSRDRAGKDESALSALRPALIRGRLKGRRVVVIQTGDYPDATEAANAALADAGATVTATLVLPDKWDSLSPRQRAALTPAAGTDEPGAQKAALLAALASALAAGTRGGGTTDALPALQRQGLATVSGDLSQPCALFVLVGGHADDGGGGGGVLDAAVLDGFKSLPAPVTLVGCEPLGAASSSMPAFQSAGIATVDCIDLPLGQIALPLALRGERGDYGLKPTARQPLPPDAEALGAAPLGAAQ